MFTFKKLAVSTAVVAGLGMALASPAASASTPTATDSYGQVAATEAGFAPQTFSTGCHDYSAAPGSSITASSVYGGVATFTVKSDACPVKLTFTGYTLPGGSVRPFSAQIPVDSKTASYGPGAHTVKLAALPCNWQSDLYFGDIQPHLNDAYGHSNLVPGGTNHAYDWSEGNSCGATTVMPGALCAWRGDKTELAVFKADNSGSAKVTIPVGDNNRLNAGRVALQMTTFVPGSSNPSAVAQTRDLGNGWKSAAYTVDGKTVVVNNDTKSCDSKPLSADASSAALPVAIGLAAIVGFGGFFARRRRAV